jgi:four helix bundle protein
MGDFKKLAVWQASHSLTCEVYKITRSFPRTEAYGLTSQLRRSASSISANIAEGCGRNGDGELGRFVRISLGSATELEYHLLLSRDVGYLEEPVYLELSVQARRIQKMLAGLMNALKSSSPHNRRTTKTNTHSQ